MLCLLYCLKTPLLDRVSHHSCTLWYGHLHRLDRYLRDPLVPSNCLPFSGPSSIEDVILPEYPPKRPGDGSDVLYKVTTIGPFTPTFP